MRILLTLTLGLCAAMGGLFPHTASAGPVPDGVEYSEAYITAVDGVRLHADVLKPAGLRAGEKVPVILLVGPYNAAFHPLGKFDVEGGVTGERPDTWYGEWWEAVGLFERGYAWVQVDWRGFYGSGGCPDVGGPLMQADVKTVVEWAASQPWSTGKVGMWGKSAEAFSGVMALATAPKGLAAAVIMQPPLDYHRVMYENGVGTEQAPVGNQFPAAFAALDPLPPPLLDLEQQRNALSRPQDSACHAENIRAGTDDDITSPYWRERDLVERAGRSHVPVLWAAGFNDVDATPNNLLPVYERLRGPKRAWFGQFAHDRVWNAAAKENVGKGGFGAEAIAWFDRYVKGDVGVDAQADETYVQQSDGRWRAERAWPPGDARHRPLALLPGTYRDAPGNAAEPMIAYWNVPAPLPTGNGSWSFTQPLPHDAHFAGAPRVAARVTTTAPGAQVIALLYDVDPGGVARFVSRGAFLARTAGTQDASFDLWPQDWRFTAGHRIGVLLSGADDTWYEPPSTGTHVDVDHLTLSLPFLRFDRDEFLPGDRARAMGDHVPFEVDPDVIAARTVDVELPPPLEPRNRRG